MNANHPHPSESVSPQRLHAAAAKVRRDLLAERCAAGHWIGELSTSALSTATAVSALAIVRKHLDGEAKDAKLSPLIRNGVKYLIEHQNDDGGWGDTDLSYSNIATTMLGVAALTLAGEAETHAVILQRANDYIERAGGLDGLKKRYGVDKTFVVPILTNYALAGLIEWKYVSPLPFELACVPQSWYRFVGMPVVSYAIPALVAIGQANYFHRPPWNPLMKWIRGASVNRSLEVLRKMQPQSGGYLEAVPLTSFVLMSLASTGRAEHPVAQQAVKFLQDSVRPDGSWPIDTNLATWVTTLSLNALSEGSELFADEDDPFQPAVLDWLLNCQYKVRHPFTGADPGGFGWSDLSGAVPDADDTPGALITLAAWHRRPTTTAEQKARIEEAAALALQWLVNLQNRDSGWPTFCKGWGKLPFDRSGVDLTAHVIRAFYAWLIAGEPQEDAFRRRLARGISDGNRFILSRQHSDGSWSPLWFGNQERNDEDNPIYGVAKVLAMFRDLETPPDMDSIQKGNGFLCSTQNPDGGWGGDRRMRHSNDVHSSIEETSLAVEALLPGRSEPPIQAAIDRGLAFLVTAVEQDKHRQPAPIGFYFAKLWYYERLYPLIFAASALSRATNAVAED